LTDQHQKSKNKEILLVFLRLGLTSFGGPVAHLGYFRNEFVERRKGLSDQVDADLIALCQCLPGPASSQVGFAIGTMRGGALGALMAWLGFTLPSALIMTLFALSLVSFGDLFSHDAIKGLKIVAAAVVAKAIWDMAKSLTPDRERITLALVAAGVLLLLSSSLVQILVIIGGALFGALWIREKSEPPIESVTKITISKRAGAASLVLFALLLVGLPLVTAQLQSSGLSLFDAFYRAGSLVFGGGHVVLPLLQEEVVSTGLVTTDQFLAGYGVAQAVPGPLFTFSSFLGFVSSSQPSGWLGGGIALLGIFLPSFLLVWGVLPFWSELRARPGLRNALAGVNAAVVGLLIPVFVSTVESPFDFAFGLGAFALLAIWKVPPWLVVLTAGLAGLTFSSFLS